jgi:hypothetical protein
MTYYGFRNKRTGKLVSNGRDFRFAPPRLVYADEYRAPLLVTCEVDEIAKIEHEARRMGNKIEIVRVGLTVLPGKESTK